MNEKGAGRAQYYGQKKVLGLSTSGRRHVEGLEGRVLLSTVGSPDLTFGTSGKTTTQIIAPANDVARATAQQPDGKLIVTGTSTSSTGRSFISVARYNTDGSLDSTFGTGGIETLGFNVTDGAFAVAVQGDGKIVLAGQTQPLPTSNAREVSVVRLTSNGAPDTTFNGTGQETIATGVSDAANAVAIQSDGKIVLAGTTQPSTGPIKFELIRLNPADGSLDSTFGTGGKVIASLSAGSDFAYALAIDSSQRIVAVGQSSSHFGIARFTSGGVPDSTFGTNGVVLTTVATNDTLGSVAIQSDGNIVVAGSSYNGHFYTAVARYTSSGVLDPTFGSGGIKLVGDGVHNQQCATIAITQTGGFQLTGSYTGSNILLTRLTSTGALDTSYKGTGQVVGPVASAPAAVTLATGAVTAVGYVSPTGSTTGVDYFLERFTAAGDPDTTFGAAGSLTTNFNVPTLSQANAVALQSDGKVVAVGKYVAASGAFFLVERFNTDGSLDNSFGSNGVVTSGFGGSTNLANAVLIQPDGGIVVAGSAKNPSTQGTNYAVARYLPNGTLDPTFGQSGVMFLSPFSQGGNSSDNEFATSLALQADGNILVCGTVSNDGGWVARLTPGGQQDTSYSTFDFLNPIGSGANAISIDRLGRAVVAGYRNYIYGNLILARFTTTGARDTTFGSSGIDTVYEPGGNGAFAMGLQPDGKIVVGGAIQTANNTNDFAVLRFNEDGTPDTSFGAAGTVQTDFGGASDSVLALRVLSDGSILAAGSSGANLALARYDTTGALVPGFGNGGEALTTFGAANFTEMGMAVRPNGSIVVAGRSGIDFAVGQVIGPTPDVIGGIRAGDTLTLKRDPDGQDLDWSVGTLSGQFPTNDPNGLTVNGNPGGNTLLLNYANGNPLPATLHLNGTFNLNGLQGATPLAGTTLEIGKSTVFVGYNGPSPASVIRSALAAGFNGGAWNGSSPNGVITSTAAAANPNHNTAVGWADSADGTGVNTTPNSIELKYTLAGDTNLNGAVDIFDLNALLPHFNGAGDWTSGDSTYNGTVDVFDLNALLPNFNTVLGSQAAPAAASAGVTAATPGTTAVSTTASSQTAPVLPPAIPGASDSPDLLKPRNRRWRRR